MESHQLETVFTLLHREHYRPEEVAILLGLNINVVRHAVFAHELRAKVVGHNIVRIERTDILSWLAERDGRGPEAGGPHLN